MESILDAMLSRGIVPILSTIPPHVHRPALARSYNESLRDAAKRLRLPLIDYEREILRRRPGDWDGTLLAKGDVHPRPPLAARRRRRRRPPTTCTTAATSCGAGCR
jgi:hypothetical protein